MKMLNSINSLILKRTASSFLPNILFILLCLIPFFIPSFCSLFWPQLGFSSLYFWAIHRPERLHLTLIFGLTLLQDTLWGMPLGILGCSYLMVWFCIQIYRRFLHKKSFIINWLSFLTFYFFILVVKGGLMWSLGRPWFFFPILIEYLLAFLSYPGVAALNYAVDQKMI